jgi:hypothetical protein
MAEFEDVMFDKVTKTRRCNSSLLEIAADHPRSLSLTRISVTAGVRPTDATHPQYGVA